MKMGVGIGMGMGREAFCRVQYNENMRMVRIAGGQGGRQEKKLKISRLI